MLLRKNESFLEKKQFHWSFTVSQFQTSRNPVRKRKVYKTMLVIQNSAIKCYHEFRVRSHNFTRSFSLTSKSNLIVALFKIKGLIMRLEKTNQWQELLLRAM